MRGWVSAALLLTSASVPVLAEGPSVPMGFYNCWTHTMRRPDVTFAVTGPGSYADSRGTAGTFRLEGNRIRFSGGSLDRQLAVFKEGNPPTVSILGPGGAEDAYCPRS
jgi:hypothetical protein